MRPSGCGARRRPATAGMPHPRAKSLPVPIGMTPSGVGERRPGRTRPGGWCRRLPPRRSRRERSTTALTAPLHIVGRRRHDEIDRKARTEPARDGVDGVAVLPLPGRRVHDERDARAVAEARGRPRRLAASSRRLEPMSAQEWPRPVPARRTQGSARARRCRRGDAAAGRPTGLRRGAACRSAAATRARSRARPRRGRPRARRPAWPPGCEGLHRGTRSRRANERAARYRPRGRDEGGPPRRHPREVRRPRRVRQSPAAARPGRDRIAAASKKRREASRSVMPHRCRGCPRCCAAAAMAFRAWVSSVSGPAVQLRIVVRR